jgi:hypothetical protein
MTSNKFFVGCLAGKKSLGLLLAVIITRPLLAAVPPAEKLLPPETLFVLTAPNWAKLNEIYRKAPQNQLWADPAMKPFREKFMAKWNDEIAQPLERDLGVKFADYTALLQGQLTCAVLQEDWQGKEEDDGVPAVVLLLDAKDKSELLKKNLATLRQKWTAAGKPLKTEKIRDIEFSVVTLTTNDIPPTIRKLLPQPQEIEEIGDEEKKETPPAELVIGQYESLLIVSSTLKAAEKVMVRYASAGAPTLGDTAEFANCQRALFRESPLFGWLNTKLILDVAVKALAAQQNPDAPSPIPMPDFAKIFAATGLTGMKSVALDYRDSGDGALIGIFVSAPEAARTGILKLLALEAKDAAPPAFVPANVLKFSRVRLDGSKAIATLEKMIGEISPQGTTTLNFLINNANEAARLDDPDYDLRKNIFDNLGDDLIIYEKAPQGKTFAELSSAPTLVLVASPNADKLAASLKGIFVIALPQGGTPKTREFLGRKIYSLKLGSGRESSAALHYVASGGYVAFSADETMIEEYLRSADSQIKPLRTATGFAAATDKVGGSATGFLTYENQAETTRIVLAALTQKSPDASQPDYMQVLASAFPFAPPEEKIKEWIDFSLLPSYDKLAKYYGFVVSAGQTSVNGITFRYFVPTPPELLKKPSAQ